MSIENAMAVVGVRVARRTNMHRGTVERVSVHGALLGGQSVYVRWSPTRASWQSLAELVAVDQCIAPLPGETFEEWEERTGQM